MTVLLLGRPGSAERFAQALHGVSARADKPFVAVNCAAIPDELIESELFGVEKGAFTGAHQSRAGRFERAHGGTLFPDELGELSASAQSAAARAAGEVERVGGNEARKVDVRLVAATNVDWPRRSGRHLPQGPVLPAQRLPGHDSAAARAAGRHPAAGGALHPRYGARHGKKILGITDRALAELRRYDWPGNVRELENVIERGVILAANGGQISAEQLFLPGTEAPAGVDTTPCWASRARCPACAKPRCMACWTIWPRTALGEVESVLMEAAMQRADGNLSRAARLLADAAPAGVPMEDARHAGEGRTAGAARTPTRMP